MIAGSDNVIAVMVATRAVTDVPPLDADFTFFGGLYRDVHVLITDPVHVDALDFASSGVYVSAVERQRRRAAMLSTACACATTDDDRRRSPSTP